MCHLYSAVQHGIPLQVSSATDGGSAVSIPQPEVPDEALADTFKRKGNVSRGARGARYSLTFRSACCQIGLHGCVSFMRGLVA